MIEIVQFLNNAMLQENRLIMLFDLSVFFWGGGGVVIVRYQQIKMKKKFVIFYCNSKKIITACKCSYFTQVRENITIAIINLNIWKVKTKYLVHSKQVHIE